MTNEREAKDGARRGAGYASVSPLLGWAGGAALAVFLALLVTQRGYFWRYVAWTEFEVFQPRPEAGGEFVDLGEGRLGLSSKIGPWIEQRLLPRERSELAALRAEARGFFGQDEAAGAWLARVSAVSLIKDSSPFQVRVEVAMADRVRAERLAVMVGDEILQYSARLRMEEYLAKAEPLLREVEALGDQAPPELLARLRAANMGPGLSLATIRRMGPRFEPVVVRRALIGRRLAEASVPAALGALIAGFVASGVVRRVRAGRAG